MYSIIFMIEGNEIIDFSEAQTIKAYKTSNSHETIEVLCTKYGYYVKHKDVIYKVLDEIDHYNDAYGNDEPLYLEKSASPINGWYDVLDKDGNITAKFFKNGIQCNKSNLEQNYKQSYAEKKDKINTFEKHYNKNLEVINEEDENLNQSF